MTKEEARKEAKAIRQQMDITLRRQKDREIQKRLYSLPLWKESDWIFSFISYGTEVDTIEMIQQVLKEGSKHIAVPKVTAKGEMHFFEITSLEQLCPGYKGILEPENAEKVSAKEGIMLMPGLAFDYDKNRVGYGGGYYDRYLEKHDNEKMHTIALCYQEQVFSKIDAKQFDYKPKWILTDTSFW